jgi:hypothetical protein
MFLLRVGYFVALNDTLGFDNADYLPRSVKSRIESWGWLRSWCMIAWWPIRVAAEIQSIQHWCEIPVSCLRVAVEFVRRGEMARVEGNS